MHRVRWVLVIGWIILITSLFYDPVSSWFTEPANIISPLSLHVETCVKVQGQCLEEVPYALGAPIFWGIIVPASIFILFVFGHDAWRRICPLSFISQMPGALGWQRQRQRKNPKTGKVQYEIYKISKDSWLGKNHFYLQFGLLFVGLCGRILFVNSNRMALGLLLIATITAALTVGFLYGGKTWCQYFCPMAPVQKIYAEPRGLLNSKAHEGDRQPVTQSMCRTVTPEGKETSACVGCQSPCIDIDAERSYWKGILNPQEQWLYYGYVGMVVGYFIYYYLYAGSWEYYLSGVWSHEEEQLSNLMKPGFYLFHQAIAIPKLVAVPLTLAAFTLASYAIGRRLEKHYKAYLLRQKQPVDTQIIRHRMFTLCTFFIFNYFFIFAGMNNFVRLLPTPLPTVFSILMIACSSFWLYRTWRRSPSRYQREGMASRLRMQLKKLNLNVAKVLDGRSLDDLSADEVYVLAKVLPDFSQEKRQQAYRCMLKEAIEDGYVEPLNSLDNFQQLRQELTISDQDHEAILTALGKEYPDLFLPRQQFLLHKKQGTRMVGFPEKTSSKIHSRGDRVVANNIIATTDPTHKVMPRGIFMPQFSSEKSSSEKGRVRSHTHKNHTDS